MVSVGLFGGGVIKTTFFPSIPFDSFNVSLAFTPGSGEKKTLDYLKRFESAIWEVNDELVSEYTQTEPFVKFTFLTLGSASDLNEQGSHAGSISVMLRDMEGSPISSFEIADRVRAKIGYVGEAEKFTIGAVNRWGSPVAVSLLDRNLEELDQAKTFLLEKLNEIPELTNIKDTNAIGKREVQLKLKPKAFFSVSTMQASRIRCGRDFSAASHSASSTARTSSGCGYGIPRTTVPISDRLKP
jgi:multidrug efflux pump subunit AcrB